MGSGAVSGWIFRLLQTALTTFCEDAIPTFLPRPTCIVDPKLFTIRCKFGGGGVPNGTLRLLWMAHFPLAKVGNKLRVNFAPVVQLFLLLGKVAECQFSSGLRTRQTITRDHCKSLNRAYNRSSDHQSVTHLKFGGAGSTK